MAMKLDTLRDRISKANEKIAKKRNTITKKTALIEKKRAHLEKLTDPRERRWEECDIEYLEDDIKRLESEIRETEKTLEKYIAQVDGAIERQMILEKEIPEVLKDLQWELVERWDEYDEARQEQMIADRKALGYQEFRRKYRGQDTGLMSMTEMEIHAANVRAAEEIFLNLVNRVKGVTGEITSWDGLTINPDNNGFSILNGFVAGKEGRCEVESIGAGGYNIQRYHIRVLVKPIN